MMEGDVQVCRSCGSRYASDRFACTACDAGLVPEARATVLTLEAGGEPVPVGDRTFKQRTELVDELEREGVRHRWEGPLLLVEAGDVELVEALLGAGGPAASHPPPTEAPPGDWVAGEDEGEVGYELDDWLPEQQAELVALLAGDGIPNRWEGLELVVPERLADRVEELIDEIDHPDAIPAEDDDGSDDAGGELLGTLFVAADVLQRDPGDPAAVADMLDAAERADTDGVPYGLDVAIWDGVRRMAGDVADLLAEQADEERVVAAARALRDALREMV